MESSISGKTETGRGSALARVLSLAQKLLRRGFLPFDCRFALFFLIDWCVLIAGRGSRGAWERQYEDVRRKQAEKEGGATAEKVAVIQDGMSEEGRSLKEELKNLGYLVVYPSHLHPKSVSKDGEVILRCDIGREESLQAFIKKVAEKYSRISLLAVNSMEYMGRTEKYKEIVKSEKKIVPSKKKQGFITKYGEYRGIDRIVMEKDKNIRRNYLVGFLLIKGLAAALKEGAGKVVVVTDSTHGLVASGFKSPAFFSFFYSYSYSQYCRVMLALGAKARYRYLDVRVIYPGFSPASVFRGGAIIEKAFAWVSADPRMHARAIVVALLSANNPDIVSYNCYFYEEGFDKSVVDYDRANDLWEQAEVIT